MKPTKRDLLKDTIKHIDISKIDAVPFIDAMRDMSFTKANLEIIQERITQAAKACGRSPLDIQLLAVSKTFPAADVKACFDAGQRAFGENYVQEGVAKIESLKA